MSAKRARRTEVGRADVAQADFGVVRPVDYDAELLRYNIVLRQAFRIHEHDRVLDVGCGTGRRRGKRHAWPQRAM